MYRRKIQNDCNFIISQGAVGTNITVDTLCNIMSLEVFGDLLHRYARVNKLIMDTYKQKCLSPNYKSFIEDMKAVSWDSSIAEGGWWLPLYYDVDWALDLVSSAQINCKS